jgi:hypothetical protein
MEAILHGISTWCQIQQGLQLSQRVPKYGSLNPISVAITLAYSEQTRLLGWDKFLNYGLSVMEFSMAIQLWNKRPKREKHSVMKLEQLTKHSNSINSLYQAISTTWFLRNLSKKGYPEIRTHCNVGFGHIKKQWHPSKP